MPLCFGSNYICISLMELCYFNYCTGLENCGSTATVCLLRNGHELVIGHVGDSKAMMCRKGKVCCLSTERNNCLYI